MYLLFLHAVVEMIVDSLYIENDISADHGPNAHSGEIKGGLLGNHSHAY